MSVMDLFANGALVAGGAAVMKAIDAALRWRASGGVSAKRVAEAKRIEAEAEASQWATDRAQIEFGVQLLREQVASLRSDVLSTRQEAMQLHAENLALRAGVAERDYRIQELEQRVDQLSLQLQETLDLLRDREGEQGSQTPRGGIQLPKR